MTGSLAETVCAIYYILERERERYSVGRSRFHGHDRTKHAGMSCGAKQIYVYLYLCQSTTPPYTVCC